MFLKYGHIPDCFGSSYTVPIPKRDVWSRSLTVNDFRSISIRPFIYKLFQLAVINCFGSYLATSDKHLSCSHVIYALRNVIEHYVENGSTVNMCSIDVSKAFEKINHYVLLVKLMDRKIPSELLTLLEHWFLMARTCVEWGNHMSHFFSLRAGVRQGDVLSHSFFLFI
jgi:hypothetical protein